MQQKEITSGTEGIQEKGVVLAFITHQKYTGSKSIPDLKMETEIRIKF